MTTISRSDVATIVDLVNADEFGSAVRHVQMVYGVSQEEAVNIVDCEMEDRKVDPNVLKPNTEPDEDWDGLS